MTHVASVMPGLYHSSIVTLGERHVFLSLTSALLTSWRLACAPPVPDSQTRPLHSPGGLWWVSLRVYQQLYKKTLQKLDPSSRQLSRAAGNPRLGSGGGS